MKILIAGDYCPQGRVASMLSKKDYTFFDNIKEVICDVDYSIVNFECPIVEGDSKPIVKSGPALRTICASIDSIKYAGFDCVTLANNHFRDYGDDGCITTINELQKHNIDFVGGGCNLEEAQKILYKQIDGKTLAIVNFCENEFSIATDTQAGAAPLDAVDNYNQITEARRIADYVLVIVHGGHEHYQLPSPRMKKLYRHFVTIGADAVVNHHQHCYSGYEEYCGKPIFYGIGNFCFDWKGKRSSEWNRGYCVLLEFNNEISYEICPFEQCDDDLSVRLMTDNEKIKIDEDIRLLNNIILSDDELESYFEDFVRNNDNSIQTVFFSYHNRYLNAAANRKLLPRPSSLKEIVSCFNLLCCESHRDVVTRNILRIIEQKQK